MNPVVTHQIVVSWFLLRSFGNPPSPICVYVYQSYIECPMVTTAEAQSIAHIVRTSRSHWNYVGCFRFCRGLMARVIDGIHQTHMAKSAHRVVGLLHDAPESSISEKARMRRVELSRGEQLKRATQEFPNSFHVFMDCGERRWHFTERAPCPTGIGGENTTMLGSALPDQLYSISVYPVQLALKHDVIAGLGRLQEPWLDAVGQPRFRPPLVGPSLEMPTTRYDTRWRGPIHQIQSDEVFFSGC